MSCFEAGIAALHARGLTGTGARIGHLDTGVDGSDAEIAGRLAAFRVVATDGFALSPRAAREPFAAREPNAARDRARHGTEVARLLAGARGTAPGALLWSAEVIDRGAIAARVLAGLDWLGRSGVGVICLPLGLPPPAVALRHMARALAARDVLVVAAAGNGGAGRVLAPGCFRNVLAVGATDPDGRVARYSGSIGVPAGIRPDVAAPGSGCSGEATGGTSAAAARVAGLAALLRAACPEASAGAVRRAIENSSLPPAQREDHRLRCGRVRPLEAWAALRPDPPAHGAGVPADVPAVVPAEEVPDGTLPEARLADQLRYAPEHEWVTAVLSFATIAAAEAARRRFAAASASGAGRPEQFRLKQFRLAPVVLVRGPVAEVAGLLGSPGLVAAEAADVDRSAYPFGGFG